MRGVVDSIYQWIKSFFRRQMVCVWVMNKGVPRSVGCLTENKDLFLKQHSAHSSLQAFMATKPPGATVFWALEGTGKTYTLSRMEHAAHHHRVIYIDWDRITSGHSAKEALYRQIGLDAAVETGPLSAYLPRDEGVFTTFVFDHFDRAMTADDAVSMVARLSQDSSRSSLYNLLIIVHTASHARALLTAHGWDNQGLFVRLMGPPYCGRWFSRDLAHLADERYNALVDQGGKLAPVLAIRNGLVAPDDPVLRLRAARAEAEWDAGERMLWQFRAFEV